MSQGSFSQGIDGVGRGQAGDSGSSEPQTNKLPLHMHMDLGRESTRVPVGPIPPQHGAPERVRGWDDSARSFFRE